MLERLTSRLRIEKAPGADTIHLPAWIRFLAPLVVVLLCRLPYFGMEILNSDEGLYASVARIMTEGGVLYEDAFEHAAPGIFYLYKFIFSVAGDWNMLAIRYVAILAHWAAALILGSEIRRRYGDIPGVFAAMLLAIALGGYLPQDAIAALTETFMIPFLLLAARNMLRWAETGKGNFVITALWIALAAWFKIHGLFVAVILLAAAWGARSLQTKQTFFLFPVLSLFISAGWYVLLLFPLLFDSGIEGFFTIYIKYNLFYAGAGSYDLAFLQGVWYKVWDWVLPQILVVSLAGAFLWMPVKDDQAVLARKIILGAGVGGGFLVAILGGRLFGHYFVPAAAFSAWMGAEGMAFLYQKARRNQIHWKDTIAVTAAVATILGILLPVSYFHGPAYRDQHLITQNGEPLKSRYPDLVKTIDELTPKDAKIWVWGFAPELYVFSHRDCATRFVKCDYLVGLIPWVNVDPRIDTTPYIVEGSWPKLGYDLTETPPAVIVDCAEADYQYYGKYPIDRQQQLKAFIQDNYIDVGQYDSRDLRLLEYFVDQGRFYLFRLYLRKDLAYKHGLMPNQNDTETQGEPESDAMQTEETVN